MKRIVIFKGDQQEGRTMGWQNFVKFATPSLFAVLLIFSSTLSACAGPIAETGRTLPALYKHVLQTVNAQASFNFSQVHVVYSNVLVVRRSDASEHISVVLNGPHKQVAWLILTSPWKPVFIASNNTDGAFNELSYDQETMSENPIANTSYEYAWDYDSINSVVFIKLRMNSAATVDIHYETARGPLGPQIQWILIIIALVAVSGTAYIYLRRRRR